MALETKQILEISEVWPDSEFAILLFLASMNGAAPFAVWAEKKVDNSDLIKPKFFQGEDEARKAFALLTDVLVELTDPNIEFLKQAPLTRRQ